MPVRVLLFRARAGHYPSQGLRNPRLCRDLDSDNLKLSVRPSAHTLLLTTNVLFRRFAMWLRAFGAVSMFSGVEGPSHCSQRAEE